MTGKTSVVSLKYFISRDSPISTDYQKHSGSIGEALHTYNFGALGIKWLIDLQDQLMTAITPTIVSQVCILR